MTSSSAPAAADPNATLRNIRRMLPVKVEEISLLVTAPRRGIKTTKKTACTCIANIDVVPGQPNAGLAEINLSRLRVRDGPSYTIALMVVSLLVCGCASANAGQSGNRNNANGTPADPMAVMNQRPLQQPVLAPNASCPASSMVNLMGAGAGYGFGEWPVFISGQTTWYAVTGRHAHRGSSYSGPLLVRAFQLGGDGRLKITLAEDDLSPAALAGSKATAQSSVEVVSGIHTAQGGLEL